VSADKARLLRDFGVNRISMGVQSLDEALLDRLGRIHSRDQVFKSYGILRHAGFENINVDLMFAIPGQTLEIWKKTLAEAAGLESEHLSSYEVIYEEDTPLYRQLKAGEVDVDEELACAMFDALLESAHAAGFTQYEVANFAKGGSGTESIPMLACRHNVNYWKGGSYLGLGPSAAGFVQGIRTKNWSNTVLYCEQLEKGRRAIDSTEQLPPLGRAGEIAAFGLRMNSGWSFLEFRQRTGFELREEWRREMNLALEKGWARETEERFQLTPSGLRFADSVAEDFLRV
jgi:oxygen-independent coproporphyrinogen-3 oxidase